MKQMMSVILLSIVTFCLVACSVRLKEVHPVALSNDNGEWDMNSLTDHQIEEINEYFKALTITRFGAYEEGDDNSVKVLNLGTQLIQLEYPAMVEMMRKDDESYVSFDKQMIEAIVEQYFNEKIKSSGIYIDLGDVIARPNVQLKQYSIYPQFHQCYQNEDGSLTFDFDLYELSEDLQVMPHLTPNWQNEIDCQRIGAASATLHYDENESYLMSYHPIYFK